MIRTLGRKPTLGEVLDYYTGDDFLQFLLDTCHMRRVVMVIPEHLHWEPNWGRDGVQAKSVVSARQYVLHKISEALPGVDLDERPDYYPSFHQSVWKWPQGTEQDGIKSENSGPRVLDCVFEADFTTWRESFQDVYPIVDLMSRHGIRYQHKFSGHRSLHVAIPAEAIPRGYRGKGEKSLARRLFRWGGSQAHRLPKITRMPYSLNEDTGLVCLPIERGALGSFRPWQANLHLVEIRGLGGERASDDDRTRMEAVVEVLGGPETQARDSSDAPATRAIFVADRTQIAAQYQERFCVLGRESDRAHIGELFAGDREVAEQVLLDGLAHPDPDERWLTVEAFLLSGASLSRDGFLRLLEQEEEYARPAAVDVLLRFEKDILPELVRMIGDLGRHPDVGAKAAYLLAQNDSLRDRVLEALVQHRGRSRDALIAGACLTGAMAGDWRGAFHLLEPVRNAADLSEAHRARLAALEVMSTLGGWDKQQEGRKSQMLAELGQEVTDLLLVAATSPRRRFRRGIVGALAALADPRAVDLLIRSLADDYSKVRRKALTGLIRIGEAAVDPLIEATASDQVPVRRYAVHCLGCIGAERAKPVVLQALDDGEDIVRRQALRALQKLATVDDISRLEQVLRKESYDNAMEAVEVIAALGEAGSVAMHEMALRERNPAAAYLLARQGDSRGRDILAERLAEGGEEREDAAEFLRELRDERCIPFFAGVLKTITHWRGSFIALELGRIGTPEAVAVLIEALSRDSVHVRRGAVRGLAEARDPTAVPALLRCLVEDEDAKMRGLAADTLVGMGEAATEPVCRALAQAPELNSRRSHHLRRVLRELCL